MLKFTEYLTESKVGKNLHLEHLEDRILDLGKPGGKATIDFIVSLRDMLAGSVKKSVSITTKWDGAPSIFAGIDPSDGKFFVAKKGLFNANPKLYKTQGDIDSDLDGSLKTKFTVALKELKKIGIKGVLQGDFMFSKDDIKSEEIDGQEFITFRPNTITYAVPKDSDLAKKMLAAEIGVVFHTSYAGKTIPEMKATFGATVAGLKHIPSVWFDDAHYKDYSGKITFTAPEEKIVDAKILDMKKIFANINVSELGAFLRVMNSLPGKYSMASIKTFNNAVIRSGKNWPRGEEYVRAYLAHVIDVFSKASDKLKTDKSKDQVKKEGQQYIIHIRQHVHILIALNAFQHDVVDAKNLILKKLNTIGHIRTFLKTDAGYKVTPAEGYVAIDHITGGAVKIVDRLTFSHANFTVQKDWIK